MWVLHYLETDMYSKPCQASKMERFAKTVSSFQPLTIFTKRFISDVWQGSEYVSDISTFEKKENH